VARCLIIGCGCRGRALGGELIAQGHAVRGTTRSRSELGTIEAAGIEAHLGDPDRVATLAPAFEHVSIACVLLGSAGGGPEPLRALHGTRLEMLLARMLDTTIRGVLYEAAGSVDPEVLAAGARIVRRVCGDSLIPYAVLSRNPDEHPAWRRDALSALQQLLAPPA
jgi:uncharacterized protein YbjT (DUF2867 family)